MPTHEALSPSKRPTQLDVARLAGVSRATVSYVVNGLTDGKAPISPETRRRVERAIADLGYEPDAGARALRSGSSQTIGLILPDLRNPHFWENAEGVEEEARAAGYRLLFSSMDLNAEYGTELFRDLSGRRIDGLILTGCLVDQSPMSQQILARSVKRGLPIVEISDRPLQDIRIDCVIADYQAATADAMAHLLALGHRRIGMVYGVATAELGMDRLQPYHAALQEAGSPIDSALLIECGPSVEDSYQASQQLLALPDRPTAILAINDLLAIGVLRAAADCGLHVPVDLSLVGFDDILLAKYLTPRLTTGAKDAVRMGREALRLILARLREPARPREVVRIPTAFIVRESTGPAPVAPPAVADRR